jgi:hypothetical protein
MRDHKTFLEIRVTLADREGRPMDLTPAMAELMLKPKDGAACVQAMQLMSPAAGTAPAALEPAGPDPKRLDDGTVVRLSVLRPTKPFETMGASTAYFKADVEAPPSGGEIAAQLKLTLPQGKKVLEFQLPAAGK